MSAILQPVKKGQLHVELATTEQDVRDSQRLRYRVFVEELGARIASAHLGIDEDRFDAHCDHLLVRETATGRVVASTRLLTQERRERAPGYYSATEFDIGAIAALPGRKLEVGRTCVDPSHRQGAAIAVLWSGLAGYLHLKGIDFLFGCASIDLSDGGLRAAAIMNRLRQHAMARAERKVSPRHPLPHISVDGTNIAAPLPPLLKAYVRLGAKMCGEACWDPEFGVADVFMLLDMDELDPSYSRHFMSRAMSE